MGKIAGGKAKRWGAHDVFLGTGGRLTWLDYNEEMEGLIKTGLESKPKTRPDGSCRLW